MLYFESDYLEGAHPQILKVLVDTNMEKASGYGNDKFCEEARIKIKKECKNEDIEIYFLVGGTQTNKIVIDGLLLNHEGVVAANTGHISIHEAGAIESTGHKVLTIPNKNGKLLANEVKKYLNDFYEDKNHEHMVFPGMVYISHPTEYGTLYTKNELKDLSDICKEYEIPLYLDGARLGYGLMAKETDVTLEDIVKFCDVFYIGGTKVGALCGEAVIVTRRDKIKRFFTLIKQNGGLLAKGRLLGIQFSTLFEDNLYYRISKHAIDMAEEMKKILKEKGYKFFLETPTNQQFIILDNKKMEALEKKVSFSFWEKLNDTQTVVRFATSWATKEEEIEELKNIL